ncbi:hypothetical protein ACFOWZ_40630 [Lentzea rhizosphaerae]|uniref:Pentapeptide repeat-containing protein n=1 Tax=Lentzea rhizosphaerae TaxID=2041025 RepID=A0ABV8C6V0_9PSEU
MTDALRPVEQALVEHVERGELLDLAGDSPVDEEAMRGWDESRTIRAWVVRDIMRGRLAPEPDPRGLLLRGARITGRLHLGNVISSVWLELYQCFLDEGLNARDARLAGIALSGCRLERSTGDVLSACRMTADLLWINEGTSVEGQGPTAVDLSGTHLGELDCSNAVLQSADGPALDLHSARIELDVWLSRGFKATASGEVGTVRLMAAEIGGSLNCGGARIRNDKGPAINADSLQVGRDVFLRDGFEAIGAGPEGAVNMSVARVAETISVDDATMRNETGPAFVAKGATVRLRMYWGPGFTAEGRSGDGAVLIPGAHLGGWECDGTTMRNEIGPALVAGTMRVDSDVALGAFTAVGGGNESVIDLNDITISGAFSFQPTRLTHLTNPQARISLDELTYRGLPVGIGWVEWLELLREGTLGYAAQPYQHLAAAQRAAGHDREARRILMDQRRDQIRRALNGRAERAWARFTGLVLGYGYQPWRALLGLFVVLVAGGVLAVVLGGTGLAQVRAGAAPTACPVIDRIAVGLELGTPLISTPARLRCEATNTGAGQALTITGWVLRLMAWAFATLFIAGFTGAVRKT